MVDNLFSYDLESKTMTKTITRQERVNHFVQLLIMALLAAWKHVYSKLNTTTNFDLS